MARIACVNLPTQKHVWVGLQSIFGIGRTRSKQICTSAEVAPVTKIRDLSEPEVERLRAEVAKFVIEGDLRREVGMRSEEHTSELQSLMSSSYAVFCLKKKTQHTQRNKNI